MTLFYQLDAHLWVSPSRGSLIWQYINAH